MDDSTSAIIKQLKTFKRQGLSYYQATQKLLKAGYEQYQIDDAEDIFNYSHPEAGIAPKDPSTKRRKSIDKAYEEAGQDLISDTKKRRKTNPLIKSHTSASGFFYGAISGRIWLVLILGIVLTFFIGQASAVNVDDARYCSETPYLQNGSIQNSVHCEPVKATLYGWPARGQTIDYHVPTAPSDYNAAIYILNFGFFFVATYIVDRGVGYALRR